MRNVTNLVAGSPAGVRKASKSAEFPYKDVRVPFILVPGKPAGGTVVIASHAIDKLLLLGDYEEGDLVLAPWPGRNRQDVFVIDDILKAKYALTEE